MMTMAQVESQINLFSLEEQLHLLSYIANTVSVSAKSLAQKKMPKRQAGGLTGKFYMADDFDETPDCFKEYM